MEMTHPDILKAERLGGNVNLKAPQIIGECVACGMLITDECEYYEDYENLFCSRECVDKYHGIKCIS